MARRISQCGIRTPASNFQLPASSNYLKSVGYKLTSYRVDAHKGKELSQVVAKPYQQIHKPVMPQEQGKRQGRRVEHRGDERLPYAAQLKSWVLKGDRSTEQSSFQHEGACPAGRGNNFVRHGLVAPDEEVSLIPHSSEEVGVAASVKRRVERRFSGGENAPLQQHVAGPALRPDDPESRRVARAVEEFAADDPLRRLFVEVALHRPENAGHVIPTGGLEQLEQPLLVWKLIVVDKGDKLASGMGHRPVAGHADILKGLERVRNWNC